MQFFRSPIFFIAILLQIAGPLLFSFGDWANVIQYLSGFGMAYAIYQYEVHHKKQIQQILHHFKEGSK
ncbi:hypothetical protein SD70_27135 [Gordoniibacillus kamchatkensis]|uniref:Uncharacterized protein n=1 Tax=Gordoniibacillus kamchatkensis TaxID=1590651 RepID=A0ABR5ABA1_9BACL|nr:hypothetical protein SD70_27135 [Paenibacillus sp. VKM B-2647]